MEESDTIQCIKRYGQIIAGPPQGPDVRCVPTSVRPPAVHNPSSLCRPLAVWTNSPHCIVPIHTNSPSSAGQLSDGKSCSIGTSHCRQPFQCAINMMRQTRLKIRMNFPATARNCNQHLRAITSAAERTQSSKCFKR